MKLQRLQNETLYHLCQLYHFEQVKARHPAARASRLLSDYPYPSIRPTPTKLHITGPLKHGGTTF